MYTEKDEKTMDAMTTCNVQLLPVYDTIPVLVFRSIPPTFMIESDWINRTEQIRLRLTQLRDSL